jgi:hypothetical protein
MLSPLRAFLAHQPRHPPKAFHAQRQFPPSVTSVTSVRCFPLLRALLAHQPRRPPTAFHAQRQFRIKGVLLLKRELLGSLLRQIGGFFPTPGIDAPK